ncbi:MAG: hypothetical protein FWD52_09610 [Candidatus Bathyarchaeota archaeon]|nr:hypothetical protein [Candidatus Termiticorpusculum sp.]
MIDPRVWTTLNTVSPAISDEELFLLDVAVLFHDYSMTPVIDEVQRGYHSETSAKEFYRVSRESSFISIFNETQRRIIMDIIQAHSDVVRDSETGAKLVPPIKTLNKVSDYVGLSIRVTLLAGILLIADELDVTQERSPETCENALEKLSKIASMSIAVKAKVEESIGHWCKLKYFSYIHRDNCGSVKLMVNENEYRFNPDKADEVIGLVISKITEKLTYVKKVVGMSTFRQLVEVECVEADFSDVFKDKKYELNCRTRVFYKTVLPFLLKSYIPDEMPVIFGKLAKDNASTYDDKVLPFIPLVLPDQAENLKLSKYQGVRRFITPDKVFAEFQNWQINRCGGNFVNADTCILESIVNNDELIVGKGDYYSSNCTSDVNFFNLIRFFPEKYFYTKSGLSDVTHASSPFFDAIDHWTKQLRAVVQDSSFVFDSYYAGLGVSTLTVIKKNDGDYWYPITKNSVAKAAGGHDRIVIPAGTYQPCDWDSAHDMDFRLQVLREFGEELLNETDLRCVPTKSLYEVLQEKRASSHVFGRLIDDVLQGRPGVKLVCTGVAFDILRMRPEITCLLLLEDPFYGELEYTKSWESDEIKWFKLYDDKEFEALIGDKEEPLVPPGLAALIWGRQKAIEYINKNKDSS